MWGYTVKDKIVQKSFEILKNFDRPVISKIIEDYSSVGGIPTQIWTNEKLGEAYLRGTTDHDVVTKKRIRKSQFREICDYIADNLPNGYEITFDTKRTCFEIKLEKGKESFAIHIPHFTEKRYELQRERLAEIIENSREWNGINVESIPDIVIGKINRSLACSGDKDYVKEKIFWMKKKIFQDPVKARKVVDDLRMRLSSQVEDGDFWDRSVQDTLKELKVTKDAYDIA